MPTAALGRQLSVALIVRNEQDVLAETLESVRPIADEIVIVDTGSTDATSDIARRHGARVIERPWDDDFSAARNAALPECRGQWILWLDAGEQLPDDTARELRGFLDGSADPRTAYLLYVELPPTAPSAAAERIARLRLLPHVPGIRFQGRTRETPRDTILAQGLGVELKAWTILRNRRDHSVQLKQARARRDLLLLNRETQEHGPRPKLLAALGDVHSALENHAAAADCYRQAIEQAERGSTDMLSAYYGLLTTFGDGQHAERLAVCLQALDIFPLDAQLLCAMGNYLQSQGQLELSCRAYESAVRFGQVDPETWHLSEIAEVAAICLSTTWQLQKNDGQARRSLEEALQRLPHSTRLRRNLIELQCRGGQLLEALAEAENLPRDFPHREAYRSAIRGACQAARGNWIPAAAYLQTAHAAGCRETLCLRWLSLSLLASDRRDEAEVILLEWLSREPHNLEARRYLQTLPASPAALADGNPMVSATATESNLRLDPAGRPHSPRPAHTDSRAARETP
jgi:tetratricopeptide (TPR) repeat protein